MRAEGLSSFALQKRHHVEDGPKLFVLGPLIRRQRSVISTLGKFVQTRLVRRISAQVDNPLRRLGRKTLNKWVERLFEYFGRAHKKLADRQCGGRATLGRFIVRTDHRAANSGRRNRDYLHAERSQTDLAR
jgi:hypothetical protein